MIYGWGKRSKDWDMPDGRKLICTYSYVSLMFVFKFVWSRKWHLIGRDRAMDVETNRSELERTYGPGNVPDIGIFERFGMFITGGVIVAAALVSLVVQTVLPGDDSEVVAAGAIGGEPVAVIVDPDDADQTGEADQTDDVGDDGESGDDAGSQNANPGDDDATTGSTGSSESQESSSDGSASTGQTDSGSDTDMGSDAGSEDEPQPTETTAAPALIFETAEVPGADNGQTFVSTNVDNPTQGWSELTVHRVYATSLYGESMADAGQKHLVVEYQLLGIQNLSNLLGSAFRVDVDGIDYSPSLTRINNTVNAGQAVNSEVIFTVPVDVTDFRLEVGALDPDGDGFQSSYNMTLVAAEAPAEPTRFTGPDQVGTVSMVSELNEFTGSPGSPGQPPLEIEVIDATATAKVGADAAKPGFKFVVVDAQVRGRSGIANFQHQTFRMQAGGELFPGIDRLNDTVSAGETWQGTVRFEVPADAAVVELQVGVPAQFENGHRAVFEISFQ